MTLKAGVDMLKKIDDKTTKNLAKAFVAINSEEECLKFLSDLCTISEIKAMAQRLEVAYMLDNGKVYNDIAAKTEKVPVRLNILMDKIEITCMTGKGQVHDVVDVSVNGEDIEIGFNHKYLLEALRSCEDENIRIEFSNPRSSCFIRSDEDNSFTYMVLPVRLYN